MINKHKQKGAETVEFAMIALLFFAMLFAVIEFSRALFVWNALAEATRRGARMAVICPYKSPVPAQVAIFKNAIDGSGDTIIGGLTTDMLRVRYFDKDYAEVVDVKNQSLITFVEVKISGYIHTLIIPLWGSSITAPAFTTTLYSESLGAVPTYPGDPVKPADCNF